MITDQETRNIVLIFSYVVKVKGEKGEASHTDDESDIGMYTNW